MERVACLLVASVLRGRLFGRYCLYVANSGTKKFQSNGGVDAILLFVRGVNQSSMGECDVNDLCERAEMGGFCVHPGRRRRCDEHSAGKR